MISKIFNMLKVDSGATKNVFKVFDQICLYFWEMLLVNIWTVILKFVGGFYLNHFYTTSLNI